MRYKGQSFELTIPFYLEKDENEDYQRRFHEFHERTYGYQRHQSSLEIVNIRVKATGIVITPNLKRKKPGKPDPSPAYISHRKVVFPSITEKIPFYHGEKLEPGNVINGPAVVIRKDTTILLESGDLGKVDRYDNIIIDVHEVDPA